MREDLYRSQSTEAAAAERSITVTKPGGVSFQEYVAAGPADLKPLSVPGAEPRGLSGPSKKDAKSGKELDALPAVTIDDRLDGGKPETLKRPDNGTYETVFGRVTRTLSADGRKERVISYDTQDPSKVSAVKIDGNRNYIRRPGTDIWDYYKGSRLVGQWHGDINMDQSGLYSYRPRNGKPHYFGSAAQELNEVPKPDVPKPKPGPRPDLPPLPVPQIDVQPAPKPGPGIPPEIRPVPIPQGDPPPTPKPQPVPPIRTETPPVRGETPPAPPKPGQQTRPLIDDDLFKPDLKQPVKPADGAPAKPVIPGLSDDLFVPDTSDRPVVPRVENSRTVEQARRDLLEAGRNAGVDVEKLQTYATTLEARAKDYWLSGDQIAKTYDNVTALLKAPGSSNFSKEENIRLGMETMFNIATSKDINQSSHPTCNVATVEVFAAAREPEKYSDMVKQLALAGEWKAADGTVIHPPKDALRPGIDEKAFDLNSPYSDRRNLASELVQNTLVNAVFEAGKILGDDGKPLRHKWTMGPAQETTATDREGRTQVYSREDRMVDSTNKPVMENGKPKTDTGFTERQIQEAAKLMLGHEMPYMKGPWRYSMDPGEIPDRIKDLPEQQQLLKLKKEGGLPIALHTLTDKHIQNLDDVAIKGGECYVHVVDQNTSRNHGWVSLKELQKDGPQLAWRSDLPTADRLLKLKEQHQLPAGFHTYWGKIDHVETIHDVRVKDGTCWVLVDNQHGKNRDGWITLDELHEAQLKPDAPQPVREQPGGKVKDYHLGYTPVPTRYFFSSTPGPYYPPKMLT